MGGELDKRPGSATTDAATGGAAPAPPGKSSLTAPPLPRTTAEMGPVRVTADRLNVRKTPAIDPGNVLGGLEQGQVVNAVGHSGDWIQIAFGAGPAFVSKMFVEPASPTSGPGTPSGPEAPPVPAPQPTQPPAATPPPAVADTPAPTPVSAPVAAQPAPTTAPAIAAPAVHPQPAPAAMAHAPSAGEFVTASGNTIAKTTPAEAAVLNQLRHDPRRLDPAWLEAAQHALGVQDATGAMNTETLRAMREHAHQPKLDAAGILSEAFLTPLSPGKPFHDGVKTGENKDKQPADPAGTTIKDRAAQHLGFESYKAYHASWGSDPVVFLGVSLGHPAHPYLRARVRVAEAYLRNRVKSPSGQPLDDAGIRKAIGWNGKGNASYHDELDKNMDFVHPHVMGHAIDIDPGQNPYFFDHSVANADFWVGLLERLFQYATKLYGGDALTAASMLEMSQHMSTEELYPRIKASSQSFTKLIELSTRANQDESPTGEISTSLAKVGYEGDALKNAAHEVAKAEELFHKQEGRKGAKQATNQSQELVIALRDAAGLAWGGTEMSGIENGDFMHWDCRQTDFGHQVIAAGAAAKKAAAEAKKAAAKK